MRRLERSFETDLTRELQRLRRRIEQGIRAENAEEMLSRLNEEKNTAPLRRLLAAHLQKAAVAGAHYGAQFISDERGSEDSTRALSLGVWTLINRWAADWARRYSYELIQGLIETTRERIRHLISSFITSTQTVGELFQGIQESGAYSPERAQAIAVTEVTRAFAEGNLEAWRASGVVQGKRWNTNNDHLVCPTCGPLNQRVVPLEGTFGGEILAPPAHVRCRCWLTPVVTPVPAETHEAGISAFNWYPPPDPERLENVILEAETARLKILNGNSDLTERLRLAYAELVSLQTSLAKLDPEEFGYLQQRRKLFDLLKLATSEFRELELNAQDYFFRILRVTDPATIPFDFSRAPDRLQEPPTGWNDFLSLISSQSPLAGLVISIREATTGRSYERLGSIFLDEETDNRFPADYRRTLIHELGHVLEDANTLISVRVRQLLEDRTQGEEAQLLRELTGQNFGPTEWARPDAFIDPYMGKHYDSGSTELLSTGLEAYFTRTWELAAGDPELFSFIYAIVHGYMIPRAGR